MTQRLFAAALAIALAGCAGTPPPPTVITVTRELRPVVPAECTAAGPARPKLAGGLARDVGETIKAYKRALKRSAALRDVCRRSLAAQS